MKYILMISTICLLFLSCGKEETTLADIAAEQDVEILEYLVANNVTDWMRTESGLYYKITESVDEPRVVPNLASNITINYTGYFQDGEVFESSFNTASQTTFLLSSAILGWQEGFQLMAQGESATLYVPSHLGLGQFGNQTIPPNTWLIFDVVLEFVDNRDADQIAADQDLEIQAYLVENNVTDWVKTDSGLYYKITGAVDEPRETPTLVNDLTVHYEGYLANGDVFDSSYDRGAPSTFPLSGVILGWQEGMQYIARGEAATLYIPSHLAYGQSGTTTIGPNTWLIFDVELLDF